MYNEKDIKLTINKLWREIKEIKLEQNNALYSVNIRVAQIFVLMKIINKEEMFTKEEIQATGLLQQANIKYSNFSIPVPIKEEENPKIRNKNAQELKPQERI